MANSIAMVLFFNQIFFFDYLELGVTEEVIEACLSRICFVESKEVTMRARDVQYELPIDSGKICVNIPGRARHEPSEALFGKNEFGINIAEFICETLMKVLPNNHYDA